MTFGAHDSIETELVTNRARIIGDAEIILPLQFHAAESFVSPDAMACIILPERTRKSEQHQDQPRKLDRLLRHLHCVLSHGPMTCRGVFQSLAL